MTDLYTSKDLITLSSKIKLFTKLELFKNRSEYEKALISRKVAILHEGRVYFKIDALINALDSITISESSILDLKNIISQYPGSKININNSVLIDTVNELEKLLGNKYNKTLSMNDDLVRVMGLDLKVDLYSFNFTI